MYEQSPLRGSAPLLAPGCHVPRAPGEGFQARGQLAAAAFLLGMLCRLFGAFLTRGTQTLCLPSAQAGCWAGGPRGSAPHPRHFCSGAAAGLGGRLGFFPPPAGGRPRAAGRGPAARRGPPFPLRPPPRSPRSAGRLCKMAAAAERGAGLPAEPPPPPPRGVRPPPLGPEEVARRLAVTRRELSNRRKILLRNLPAESSSQVRPAPAAGREAEGLPPPSAAATKSSPGAPLGFSRRFVAARGSGSGRLREPRRCGRAGRARGCAARQRRSASRVWRCREGGGAASRSRKVPLRLFALCGTTALSYTAAASGAAPRHLQRPGGTARSRSRSRAAVRTALPSAEGGSGARVSLSLRSAAPSLRFGGRLPQPRLLPGLRSRCWSPRVAGNGGCGNEDFAWYGVTIYT